MRFCGAFWSWQCHQPQPVGPRHPSLLPPSHRSPLWARGSRCYSLGDIGGQLQHCHRGQPPLGVLAAPCRKETGRALSFQPQLCLRQLGMGALCCRELSQQQSRQTCSPVPRQPKANPLSRPALAAQSSPLVCVSSVSCVPPQALYPRAPESIRFPRTFSWEAGAAGQCCSRQHPPAWPWGHQLLRALRRDAVSSHCITGVWPPAPS